MTKPTYSRHSPGKYALFMDWETTGADFDSGKTTERYQGISFGAVVADIETFEEVDSLYRELKFDSKKYQWTDGAEKIHGLSREYLAEHGVEREEALADLLEFVLKYFGTGKICFGGHNTAFDIMFTNQLTSDFGCALDLHHVILETSGAAMIAIGKHRSNEVFPLFCGEEREKHNALEDARQSLAVARGIRQLCTAALESE